MVRDLDNGGGDSTSHPCQPKLETLSEIRTLALCSALAVRYLLLSESAEVVRCQVQRLSRITLESIYYWARVMCRKSWFAKNTRNFINASIEALGHYDP